jgi:hypothetical protein
MAQRWVLLGVSLIGAVSCANADPQARERATARDGSTGGSFANDAGHGNGGAGGVREAVLGGAGDIPEAGAAPPTVADEVAIPGPSGSSSATIPSEPALAFGGGVYLMAWTDKRLDGDTQVGDVFVARFSESGQALDARAIAIGTAPQSEALPTLAFDGTNFFVAWFRYGIPPYNAGGDVIGVRVTPSGDVIDTDPIVIVPNAYAPAVVSRSPGWTVAADDVSDERVLRLANVDANGTPGPVRSVNARMDSYGRMAAGAGTLLVVGRSNATLIDANTYATTPLNPPLFPTGTWDVSWNGNAYYVVSPSPAGGAVSLTRITAAGDMTSVSLPATSGYGTTVAAKADVALVAYGSLKAQWVPLPSMQAGTEFVIDSTPTSALEGPVAVSGASGFGVGWIGGSSDASGSNVPKFAIMGGADGGGVEITMVPRGSADQLSPVVSADDAGFSLAWTEATDVGSVVRLMRFDSSGTAREGAPSDVA